MTNPAANRSKAVTALAIAYIVLGGIQILAGTGLTLLNLPDFFSAGGHHNDGGYALIALLVLGLGIVISVVMIVIGYAILHRLPWGRIAALVFAVLGLLATARSLVFASWDPGPMSASPGDLVHWLFVGLSVFGIGFNACVCTILFTPKYAAEFAGSHPED